MGIYLDNYFDICAEELRLMENAKRGKKYKPPRLKKAKKVNTIRKHKHRRK